MRQGAVRGNLDELMTRAGYPRLTAKHFPLRCFKTSPEIICFEVMMYIQSPLSPRNVEDLLPERGTDICHETLRYWRNRFGPMFADEIRKRRFQSHTNSNWQWHLDEMFVTINGETHYLWRIVDHKDEIPETFVARRCDRSAANGTALPMPWTEEGTMMLCGQYHYPGKYDKNSEPLA